MPGMLTGAIIGMSRALGESAPLLMIGMVAFIVDVPAGLTDPATALPVQIYLWADSPERAFAERTAAAIVVLLGFLLLMNLAAVIIAQTNGTQVVRARSALADSCISMVTMSQHRTRTTRRPQRIA